MYYTTGNEKCHAHMAKNSKITTNWKPRLRIEGSIKINLKGIKCEMYNGIQITHGKVKY
jgi:hypothetical protein